MTSQLECVEKALGGVTLYRRVLHNDNRGHFGRLFCKSELAEMGVWADIRQINLSHTDKAGTVRGLHYQTAPHCECKIITCVSGSVFDVAVDLRYDSPTFSQWFGCVLSSQNRLSIVIPEGFAHGFQSLEADSSLLYLHTADYASSHETGIHFADPTLSIKWPMTVGDMSPRDLALSLLQENFKGLKL